MIATTFNSEAVYLLPYFPSVGASSASFEMFTRGERSRSGIEGRAAMRYTLRTRFQFTISVVDEEERAFRAALKQLENKRVLCPFWPAQRAASDTSAPAAFTGIWLTIEDDLSAWEIHTAAAPSVMVPTANAWRVPLMLGFFEEEPAPIAEGGGVSTVQIRFMEAGPAAYALRPRSSSFTDGPSLGARTPKVFPLAANWAGRPGIGQASVVIDRSDETFTREFPESYEPQTPERVLDLTISTFDDDEFAKLLGFFHARQGNVESFWLEGEGPEVELAADTSAGSAVVSVVDVSHLADTRFLAFSVPGQASILRSIVSIDEGANTVTLNASPGVFIKGATRVLALILARFDSSTLGVNFTSGVVSDSRILFRETPAEYTAPAGHTYGLDFGALPRTAYVYRFILKYPAGDAVTRYAAYEREINASGEIFTPLPGLKHSDIASSLDVERSSVKFSDVRIPATGPLSRLSPYRLEVPLWVEILEVVPAADGTAGTPTHRFLGTVVKPKRRGPWLEFEAIHVLGHLDQQVPSMLIQPSDNYELFSGPNGLDEADWTFAADIVSVSSSGASITIDSLARTAGVPTIGAGYFANGRVWIGAGSTLQSRTIINSTALAGGELTIHLAQAFEGAPTGSLSLSPGYLGSVAEAKTKFNNYARFGGFPFVPVGNPSLVPIKDEPKTGKK